MARPRQVSDEEILDVARDCFMDDPNTSTVTIAQRLGLSQAAIFKRFGTKMRLFLASMGVETGPPWVAQANAGPDERPMQEQLEELAVTVNQFFDKLIPRVQAMKAIGLNFSEMFGDDEVPPPIVGFNALRGWFQRAIDQGRIREADPGELAITFIGMFQARAFWSHIGAKHFSAPIPNDRFEEHVVDLFWRGVAPEEAS